IVTSLAKKVLKKQRLFTATPLNIPLLLLFLMTCLSFINSINYFDTLKGGVFRLIGYILIFFVMVEEIKGPRHIKRIIFAISSGIILASFDGLWQILTGRDFIRGYAPVINIGLVRATAAFKDSNLLGIYLSAFAPLILGLNPYYFKNKKIVFIFVSLISLIGIIITYSRPTLLAIYIALLFLSIVKRDKRIIYFLIMILLIAPFILPQSVKNWAKEVEYSPLRFMCNDDRIAVYRNSLNMIKDHPFIGLGANTYMKNYKKYREPVEYRNIVTKDYMYAHNNFLHMAAEIGLIGLGIFIWLLYELFMESKNIYRNLDDGYLKIVSLSLSACLIAFLVNGLTESSLYYSRVAIIFWYIMGFSLALNKFTLQQKDKL
ncbi:MAG: O-antigen ligase family protein, partial [Candidatus Omnitrophota bacterium]|nr:O-antigen ligase family protein [Candidatus Omnitrophota bacterium]